MPARQPVRRIIRRIVAPFIPGYTYRGWFRKIREKGLINENIKKRDLGS